MHFKSAKPNPMSDGTRELGTQFVQALLKEGHGYHSIKANVLGLLAQIAAKDASLKLASNTGAILERSGLVRGSITEAAKNLHMTKQNFRKLYRWSEGMAAR